MSYRLIWIIPFWSLFSFLPPFPSLSPFSPLIFSSFIFFLTFLFPTLRKTLLFPSYKAKKISFFFKLVISFSVYDYDSIRERKCDDNLKTTRGAISKIIYRVSQKRRTFLRIEKYSWYSNDRKVNGYKYMNMYIWTINWWLQTISEER